MDIDERLRTWWDEDASVYDRSPSHALSDPVERAAWRSALSRHLPAPGAAVLDVGAGTGAISLLAAELGYRVTSLDLSPRMLAVARQKAEAAGVDLDTVVGPATDPPPGPFDAVIERHVVWTLPDPAAALGAWRKVAPNGRLVLYEGLFDDRSVERRARHFTAGLVRRATGQRHEHHAGYDPEVLAALPLVGSRYPSALIGAVREASWQRLRLERLRDVEWARRLGAPPLLGWLESVPLFALLAD